MRRATICSILARLVLFFSVLLDVMDRKSPSCCAGLTATWNRTPWPLTERARMYGHKGRPAPLERPGRWRTT